MHDFGDSPTRRSSHSTNPEVERRRPRRDQRPPFRGSIPDKPVKSNNLQFGCEDHTRWGRIGLGCLFSRCASPSISTLLEGCRPSGRGSHSGEPSWNGLMRTLRMFELNVTGGNCSPCMGELMRATAAAEAARHNRHATGHGHFQRSLSRRGLQGRATMHHTRSLISEPCNFDCLKLCFSVADAPSSGLVPVQTEAWSGDISNPMQV